MAAPDPLRGTGEEFLPSDWKELIASLRPSGDNSFSKTSGEASLVGVVDEAKVRGCLRFCLGYDVVNNDTGTVGGIRLRRTNPVRHPRYPKLWCTGAAETGLSPDPQGTLRTTMVAGNPEPVNRGAGPGSPVNVLGANAQGFRAKYRKARVALRFEPLPFRVQEDVPDSTGLANSEFNRNVTVDMEPRAELLSLSGFSMVYCEGTGLPVATHSTPQGQAYPCDVGQVLVKSDLRVTWYHVPDGWVFATPNLTWSPARILPRLGCVNHATFMGFARGTLLLNAVKFVRHPWTLQVSPKDVNDGTEPEFYYTVEFSMQFFDPEKGFTGNPAVQLIPESALGGGVRGPGAVRGHNCAPWRGGLAAGRTTDGNAGKWFFATYTGNPNDRPLFNFTDYTALFDGATNIPLGEIIFQP